MKRVGIVLGEVLWYVGRDPEGAHIFEVNVYGKLGTEHSDVLRELLIHSKSEIQIVYDDWGSYITIRLFVPERRLEDFVSRFVSDGDVFSTNGPDQPPEPPNARSA